MTAPTTGSPPAPGAVRAKLRSRLAPRAAIPLVLLLLALATVFPFGNERGHSWRGSVDIRGSTHNSITADHMAVAKNLSSKHGFLGIYFLTLDEHGDLSYHPYNRFPIGGYLLLKLATAPFGDDVSSELGAARTLMRAFFVLGAVSAYLALCRLVASRWVALAATSMAFSSYYLLYYSDMVATENMPSLFGVLLAFHGMVVFVQEGRFRQLLVKACAALLLGWHVYALLLAFIVLGLARELIRAAPLFPRIGRAGEAGAPALGRYLTLGVVTGLFGTALLSFNLGNEYFAIGGRVPLTDLPTVGSIFRRFGLDDGRHIYSAHPEILAWPRFLEGQFGRIGGMTVPFGWIESIWSSVVAESRQMADAPGMFAWGVVASGACLLGLPFVRHRMLLAALALSGFCWALPMRHNTGLHEYEAVFYVGIPLTVFSLIFLCIRRLTGARFVPVLAAVALPAFVLSNVEMADIEIYSHERIANERLMQDFDVIRDFLGEGVLYIPPQQLHWELISLMRYFLAGSVVLLPEQWRQSKLADFLMLRYRKEGPALLTPDNRWMFLYDRAGYGSYDEYVLGTSVLAGGAEADDLDGGEGMDAVSYRWSDAGVTVTLADDGTGTASGGHATGDRLRGFEHVDGSDHADALTGDAGDNALYGQGGADTLRGGAGNDWLLGGAGADDLDGGEGRDTVSYGSSDAGVTVTLADDGTGTASGGHATGDRLRGFEHVDGSDHADVLTGNAGDNALYGQGGADTLRGGAGNDWLLGGVGADDLDGGEGRDLLYGHGGADTLRGGAGNDRFDGGAGADDLDGGAGRDTVSYGNSDAGVTVTLADDGTGTASGGHAAGDRFRGIEGIEGSDHADVLTGNAGNNFLHGHGGADTLRGGAGNDWFDGGAGADDLDGGAGRDTVSYGNSDAGVTVTLADDGTGTASGGHAAGDRFRGIEGIRGSVHDDVLTGNAGDNLLAGRRGNDTLRGGGGDDRLVGGRGADDLDGGAGTDTVSYVGSKAGVTVTLADDGTGTASGGEAAGDTLRGIENLGGSGHADDVLTGNAGSNVLYGERGDDTLRGRGGDDRLEGGAGADVLEGGTGADVLTGGAGGDLFRFASGDGADVIADFADGEDRIDLRGHTGVGSFGDLTIGRSSSGDAVIGLGVGDQLTLTGVQVSALDASDFLFRAAVDGEAARCADPGAGGAPPGVGRRRGVQRAPGCADAGAAAVHDCRRTTGC